MPFITEEQKERLNFISYDLTSLIAEIERTEKRFRSASDCDDKVIDFCKLVGKVADVPPPKRISDGGQSFQGNGVSSKKENEEMLVDMPGISVTDKIRKDGRYQGYIIKDGEKKYIYGRTKEEVISKINEIIKNGFKLSRKARKKTPTVAEWTEKWFTLYKKPNLKATSISSIKSQISIINKAFGKKRLNELKSDDLQAFFVSMTAERRRDLALNVLKNALEKARKQGLIKNNPCDALEIKKHVKKKKKGLTPEEQSITLKAVKGTTIEPIFTLLLVGGFRIGELLALTDKDVDFKNNIVSINKDVVFIDGKRIVQTTKSESGVRKIPIPAYAMDYFPKKKGVLFDTTYNAVRCGFKRLQEKTGIPVSAHVLRHTYSNRLEEAGVPPKVKQYLLGHSRLDTSQNIYTDTQWHYVVSNFQAIFNAFKPE